ncbi:unnamed protein product [Acanthoscelides obtectus]|uniref:ribonuclease H n=1 Tax=Acanthoscelides obtectus TaxID=200917 RepID=A0A9P0P1Y0_ACAOB|nr:unnamed protein product [Acanthoscelides obtectus]CAK1657151.1 hypothetical protein AOBTE_LOCUS20158 [Acanthoscelides obtectus]
MGSYVDYTSIFTDASKTAEGTGAAWVIPHRAEKKFKFSGQTSIFTAEAFAILKSMEFVRDSGICKCIIFSDSLSVLSCLKSPTDVNSNYYHSYIIRIKQDISKFQQYNSNKKIVLVWVKAHTGITFNERADQLAKESVSQGEEIISQHQLCMID